MKLDKKELAARAAAYGKLGAGFAFKAGILYAGLVTLGLVGGGASAYFAAGHFGYNGWWAMLAVILGIAVGGVAGFFAAKIAVLGIIEDMYWRAGIKAGKAGYEKGKELLKAQQNKSGSSEENNSN
jgi:hypothetical protein